MKKNQNLYFVLLGIMFLCCLSVAAETININTLVDKARTMKHDEFLKMAISHEKLVKLISSQEWQKKINSESNDLSLRMLPTLYDLLVEQQYKYVSSEKRDSLLNTWLAFHANDKDLLPTYYIKAKYLYPHNYKELISLYKNSPDTWQRAYLLFADFNEYSCTIQEKSELLDLCHAYKQKYPKSPFLNNIVYMINVIEHKQVMCRTNSVLRSTDSVQIVYTNTNSHHIRFEVYRVDGEAKGVSYSKADKYPLVATREIRTSLKVPFRSEDDTVSLPPLPYGTYFIHARIVDGNDNTDVQSMDKNQLPALFSVSDLRMFNIKTNDGNFRNSWEVVVDAVSANPAEKSVVSCRSSYFDNGRHKQVWKEYPLLRTNKNGEAVLGINDDDVEIKVYKDADKYLPRDYIQAREDRPLYELAAYSNSSIFRPGDTLHLSLVGSRQNHISVERLAGAEVSVRLYDSRYKEIYSYTGVLDRNGKMDVNYPFTSDMRHGRIYGNAQLFLGGTYKAYASLQYSLEDYHLPAFSISLADSCALPTYPLEKSLHGSMIRSNGQPLVDMPVIIKPSVVYGQKEFKTTYISCYSDAQGVFSFILPHDWRAEIGSGTSLRLTAEATTKEGDTQSASITIVPKKRKDNQPVYSLKDGFCPTDSVLWLPQEGITVTDKNASLVLGMPQNGMVYCVVTSRDSVLLHEWYGLKEGLHPFSFIMPQDKNNYLDVSFYMVQSDGTIVSRSRHLPNMNPTKLNLTIVSMRDFLVPDSTENWTFHFSDNSGKPVVANLLINMLDKAVDQVSRNPWQPHLLTPWQYPLCSSASPKYHISFYRNKLMLPDLSLFYFKHPVLMDYNIELLDVAEESVIYNTGASAARSSKNISDAAEDDLQEISLETQTNDNPILPASQSSQMPMREGDTRLAFFFSDIHSDRNGDVSVQCPVPPDNTQWLVQILAWDNHGGSCTYTTQLTATRPLMLHLQTPRFLRQSDLLNIPCVVDNASDIDKNVKIEMWLLDAVTMRTLTKKIVHDEVLCRNSLTVSMPVKAVREAEVIVVARVTDEDGNSDGEKRMLTILPLQEHVHEAVPFYLHSDEKDTALCLPPIVDGADNRKVTFMLCDNPLMYVFNAMPHTIDSSAVTATLLARQIYSLSIHNHLAKMQGKLEQVVDISFLITKLAKYQRQSGAFTWLYDSRSRESYYLTQNILSMLGELRQYGALNSELETMCKKGVGYLDTDVVEQEKTMKKYHKGKIDYGNFSSYAFVRAMFPYKQKTQNSAHIFGAACDSLLGDLSHRSLVGWPYTALTLERSGRHNDALKVVKSLRRYATTDKRLGMYWNNLPDCYWWYRKTDIQASFLLAFSTIDPKKQELDRMRQWLLLNNRATDWGKSSLNAYASYSLMQGSDWITAQGSDTLQYLSLPEKTSCYEFSKQSDVPAWGALMTEYSAPATSIAQFSTETISIERNYYLIDINSQLVPLPEDTVLRLGDHVRVVFRVTADQEFDHLILREPRSSLVEPSSLSGFSWQTRKNAFGDNIPHSYVLAYREVLNDETLFYIDYLPEGMSEITYDCVISATGVALAGVASVTSEQAEEFTAHTAAQSISAE